MSGDVRSVHEEGREKGEGEGREVVQETECSEVGIPNTDISTPPRLVDTALVLLILFYPAFVSFSFLPRIQDLQKRIRREKTK